MQKIYPIITLERKWENIISRLSSLIASIESDLEIPIHEIAKISELLGIIGPLGMSEKWAVAACYLSSLEIIVNKILNELGKQPSGSFKEKFRELISTLSKKGVSVGELNKKLPEYFWDLRNKVIHGGYEPDNDELNIIVEWTIKIIEILLENIDS